MPVLVRGLGFTAATSINIANMIGTGVFIKARIMTCNVESPTTVLAVWFVSGLLVLAGALTYAELATMMPRAGGEYVFLREAYGRLTGFIYGWAYLAISRAGSLAAQAVSTAIFFDIVTGGVMDRAMLPLAAFAAVAITTAVNCLPVGATGRIATALTAVKVVTVAGVGLAAFLLARGDWAHYAMSGAGGACEAVPAAARGGLNGFGAAMLGALWGFQGWATLTPLAGEVSDPQRNIPRAYVAAMLVVGALYLFANASYFYAMPPADVASVSAKSSVAAEVVRRVLGPAAVSLMAMATMISSLGALHSGIAATARVPYSMATDGLFFRWFGKLSDSSRVPVRGVLLTGLLSGALTLIGSYDKLTDWAIFNLWLFYGLTAGAVFVFRSRRPQAERPYRTLGYPLVPAAFIAVTALILINTVWTAPWQTAAGIAVLLSGLPFYAYWSRRRPDTIES